eukprot:Nitzschia sp. Nitz4//scaffold88_size82704//17209//18057//NITZ4_005284-RA/size82704-processed-gene-0.46-mRNA-1//1//CDS//3329559470//3370//frame0
MKTQWKPNFSYKVDYNDHFETPLVAYEDILPLLDGVHPTRTKKNHTLYDPYYCNGRTAEYLRQLGFAKIEHAKRDFYKDIDDNTVPDHFTLITNPPYSDQHKERCLSFCVEQFQSLQRPFFLLMPNYVASRSYYRRILGDTINDVVYVLPSKPYEYDHPEGTGHAVSPFASLWFCCVGKDRIQAISNEWASRSTGGAHLVTSMEELESLKAIPTEKRPNPRQRKKRRALLSAAGDAMTTQKPGSTAPVTNSKQPSQNPIKVSKSKKSSKYRDDRGKRAKKRF